MSNCYCGNPSVCHEVKKPGPNRGKWYWKCPTGRCRFFKWDDSAMPFIRHPREAYASVEPLGGLSRRPPSLPFLYQHPQDTTLRTVHVKVVFSLISKTRIGIRSPQNLTIDPVIASIDHILWDESLSMYTIPARLPVYNNAISTIPTDIPNIHVEIETIPMTLLDNLLAAPPEMLADNSNGMSEVEQKWLEFVESPMRNRLTEVQREGVRLGIERKGRILFGNENGIGNKEQALALCSVYKDEWPVLLTCPAVLCSSWKEDVQNFLGLDDEEVCILDNTTSLFKETMTVVSKKRKRSSEMPELVATVKSEPVIKSLSLTKPKPKKTRTRLPYAQRMKQKMANNQYESDSSEESSDEQQVEALQLDDDDDDDDVEPIQPRTKPVKFYIASHKKASKNRAKITEQQFKVMVLDGSHYLKYRDQNQTRNLCRFLKDTPRAILMSDTAIYSLPVDLYTQIQAIDEKWFPDLDKYTQRYCNPKSTVYGWTYNGKSNKEELEYVLDSKIWYCPKLVKMKYDTDIVRQTIIVPLEKKERREFQAHLLELHGGNHALEDYIKEHDLLTKTNESKREFIGHFIEYVFDIYKRPKIAIAYYDKIALGQIQIAMTKRKVKSFHLDNMQNIGEKAEEYNKSRAAQVVLIDMSLDDLSISLHSVDLVIILNLPTKNEKMAEIESYFFNLERQGPLTIKYLVAPETIETYLWPKVKQY